MVKSKVDGETAVGNLKWKIWEAVKQGDLGGYKAGEQNTAQTRLTPNSIFEMFGHHKRNRKGGI